MTNEDYYIKTVGFGANEDNYTKSIGFGYDQSEMDSNERDLLNSTIAGYLAGYLRAKGDYGKVQSTWYYRDKYVLYIDGHPMGVKDLFALRLVLPEELRNRVRLYKIVTRMVPEVFAMGISDIEMAEMKEES